MENNLYINTIQWHSQNLQKTSTHFTLALTVSEILKCIITDLQIVAKDQEVQFLNLYRWIANTKIYKTPTRFYISSHRLRDIKILNILPSKVDQRHGVQFSHWHRSIANVNIRLHITIFVSAPIHGKYQSLQKIPNVFTLGLIVSKILKS